MAALGFAALGVGLALAGCFFPPLELAAGASFEAALAASAGMQSWMNLAEVIDGADPQHLGRIRVRYYWPVKSPADAETGWVRVSTPYSGTGKGQLFTPEVGSQVLVG